MIYTVHTCYTMQMCNRTHMCNETHMCNAIHMCKVSHNKWTAAHNRCNVKYSTEFVLSQVIENYMFYFWHL